MKLNIIKNSLKNVLIITICFFSSISFAMHQEEIKGNNHFISIEELDNKVNELEIQIEGHKKRVDQILSIESKLKNLKSTVDVQKEKIDQISSLESKLKNLKSTIDVQKEKIDQISSIESKLKNLKSINDMQTKAIDYGISGASNQISAVNTVISIFSFLFAIAGLGIGIYINNTAKTATNMNDSTKVIAREVKEINEEIHTDIEGLYLRIKNEETEHILKRLIEVPEDILNLCHTLASRKLTNDHFSKLKKAFNKLELESTYLREIKDNYIVLFIQHFFAISLKDQDIGEFVKEGCPHWMRNGTLFRNDILDIISNFSERELQGNIYENSALINFFIDLILNSEEKYHKEFYQEIYNSLPDKKRKFDFYSIINNQTVKLIIGQFIKSEFEKIVDKEEIETMKSINMLIESNNK